MKILILLILTVACSSKGKNDYVTYSDKELQDLEISRLKEKVTEQRKMLDAIQDEMTCGKLVIKSKIKKCIKDRQSERWQ